MPCFACKTGLKQIRIRMFFSNVSSNRHCKILRDKIIFCTILFLVWSGQHQTVKRSGKLLTCILNVYPFLIWFPTFMPFLKFVNCYLTANQGYFYLVSWIWAFRSLLKLCLGQLMIILLKTKLIMLQKKRKSYAKYTPEDHFKIAKYGS